MVPTLSSPYWQNIALFTGLLVLLLIARLATIRYRPGLRSIPGPFLATISNLDRLWSCATGHQMLYHLALHQKYGPLVRVGPHHVSFSAGALIPQIYGVATKFVKSDFYKMFDIKAPSGGEQSTIFSVRDEEEHRVAKRPIANAYSMGVLKELEPMNDACSATFMRKMEGFAESGESFDLGEWLHWYAFDTITSITFSNRLNFMEDEQDKGGIITAIEGRLLYNSIVGQVPWLHGYLFGNTWVSWLTSSISAVAPLNKSKFIVDFAAQNLERYQNKESNTVDLPDMLDRFKRFRDGEVVMTDGQLLGHAVSNIFAGADTTAISLRAIFYYLCRHPSVYKTLLAEIDEADAQGKLSDPVTFTESMNLPYFQACIKEALRMHPAVGLLLERVVPPSGLQLTDEIWLPGGTVVGMNPWVAARDSSVYRFDASSFRPERWLEASAEQMKLMERSFLAFGAGARTCLGKNISLLEMGKLVPLVLRRFEFELVDPGREWVLWDYWFVRQTGLRCRVKRRRRS
ncbi:hypothetical protein LTR62_004459 [Meristemomyces frigidus]|uniref:Pisatin demethylase n=1 Tax=Meristemomyces frigidus TaxID=1508187 RepID=A0AAN7YJY0_9PEZI|nr:hypothetical protein LTR62_004459 [Meristemomyces frigidus]